MKQIISTLAAIALAAAIALVGSAATAGNSTVHHKKGVIFYSSDFNTRSAPREVSRFDRRGNQRFDRRIKRGNFRRSHKFYRHRSLRRALKRGGFRRY